jgi:isoquinoline 1-oxidoreductase subunit beta
MSDYARRFRSPRSLAAPCSARMGIASIEAWPAAGGGLLVGLAEPMLAGDAPLRAPVKTMFLRLDGSGEIRCILPYVTVDTEISACIRALIAEELSVTEASVTVNDAVSIFRIPDLHPSVERSLQALAAATRALLITAAAENWDLPAPACEANGGEVRSAGRSIGYREIAADAALAAVPRALRLRCGRPVFIA